MANYRTTYERSWAVVTGIDEYESMPPLRYAVADARAVAEILVNDYDFDPGHVLYLLNDAATKESIHRVIDERLTNPNQVGEDDRVLFFFAGHGVTRSGQRGDVGYIAPVDAQSGAWRTLIGMEDLVRAAEFIPAKHIFFLMDACYSGIPVSRGLSWGTYSDDMIARQAWQVLTAGGTDELVADGVGPRGRNSIFTGYLLAGLRGRAADELGVISASSLMHYVHRQVSTDARSNQTPHYGWLRGDGDFIFRRAVPDGFPSLLARKLGSPLRVVRLSAVSELKTMAAGADISQRVLARQTLEQIDSEEPDEAIRNAAHRVLGGIPGVLKPEPEPPVVPTPSPQPVPPLQPVRVPVGSPPQYPRDSVWSIIVGIIVLLFLFWVIGWQLQRAQEQDRVIAILQTQVAIVQQVVQTKQAEATATIEALAPPVVMDATPTPTVESPFFQPTSTPEPTAVVFPSATPLAPVAAVVTDVPTATATPSVALPNVVFADDFEDDDGRWQIRDVYPGVVRVIRNGRLYFQALQADLWFAMPCADCLPEIGDFVLDVDATILTPLTPDIPGKPEGGNALAIIFRAQPFSQGDGRARLEDYYYVGIEAGGQFFFYKQINGELYVITPSALLERGPLQTGVPIHITLVAEQEQFTLFIDGVEAGTGHDADFSSGRIALGVLSRTISPFEAAFDNLLISLPSAVSP